MLSGLSSCSARLVEDSEVRPPVTITEPGRAKDFGRGFAFVIKSIQMLSLVMIFIDCIFRYFGKPLYFMHTLRFAIFVYGACCPWLLGGNENASPQGYRGLGDTVFFDFFDLIYHGYWTSGYINCFVHELKVDGQPFGFLYINILFFEILLFFLGKAFVWTSWDGFYRRNRWVQFMASFKGMYLEFFGFPYAGWATFFFKQHFVMVDLEAQGKVVTGRNINTYWFSMALAIWMTYETAKSVWEIYTGNRDEFDGLVETDPRLKGNTVYDEIRFREESAEKKKLQ